MNISCESCRRLGESRLAAWLSIVGKALDAGTLDQAADAARELRRYGIELRLIPAEVRRAERKRDGAADAR